MADMGFVDRARTRGTTMNAIKVEKLYRPRHGQCYVCGSWGAGWTADFMENLAEDPYDPWSWPDWAATHDFLCSACLGPVGADAAQVMP